MRALVLLALAAAAADVTVGTDDDEHDRLVLQMSKNAWS